MKKSIALVAMAFGVTSAFAQDLTSKKGEPFLPEAGDYAISVDATPFLNYVGNFFGKSASNSAPTWNFLNSNMTITGKMFKDANTAYRASVRLGFTNQKTTTQTADRTPSSTALNFPTAPSMKDNVWKHGTMNVGLSAGMEMRRGKTRLQGYYGAEAGLGLSSYSDKYTYGNALAASTTPSANVTVSAAGDGMNGGANITTDSYGNTARITSMKSGMGIYFGVRGFVGAEYFVAPKVSIGGEFGWGLGLGVSGKTTTAIESWDSGANTSSGDPATGTQETKGGKMSMFGLDTDNNNSLFGPSGTIRLNFHF